MQKVLGRVTQVGVHSQVELARKLGRSEELLTQIVEDLSPMGYLKSVAEGCDGCCNACPLTKACAVGGPTRV